MINSVWGCKPPFLYEYEWSIRNDIPSVPGADVINVGGDIYIVGGTSSNRMIKYNIATGVAVDVAPIPLYRRQKQMAYHDGKIYVIGGNIGTTAYNNNQIYDIATNTWSNGTPDPTNQCAGACVVEGDNIHVMGGSTGGTILTSVNNIYNITTDTWSTGAPLPYGRRYSGGCVFKGEIWVIGGENSDRVDVFNLVENTWREEETLPNADIMSQRVLDIDNNYIYAFSLGAANKVYYYHPK